jgi:hypothetical protein
MMMVSFIHTYIPLTPTFYQNVIAVRNTADKTGGKPIAVWSQPISGVSAINPLVAFNDIHGRKREVIFFYFVPDVTRDKLNLKKILHKKSPQM